jgi:lipoprotein-anchoring transpeptidase ErfK/SrfK
MSLKRFLSVVAFIGTVLFAGAALADIKIVVDKSEQRAYVYQDGNLLYKWAVSTGKPGHGTDTGIFYVQSMDPDHHSKIYDGAWMPHAIFFNGNIAIHGTYKSNYKYLGGVASHGCVRLTQEHAATLYNLVLDVGPGNVKIIVQS